jgi:hypothetical protein
MTTSRQRLRTMACTCGQVELETIDAPILTVVCHCASCRSAAGRLEALPGAPAIAEADGGTAFVMQRKDRIRCIEGAELLREYRLTPTAKTRRVVAACCNAPMFLEFAGGHWLSLYRRRFREEDQPRLEMRVMTKYREAGIEFHDEMPSYASHSGGFMWKLLSAWVAMGFRAPKLDYVKGGTGHYAG